MPFQTWKTEIAAELAAAKVAVETAAVEVAAAEAATRQSRIERHAFNAAVSKIGDRAPLANALAARIQRHADVAREPETRLVRARNTLESARRQVADLRDALAQLDIAAPPPPVPEVDDEPAPMLVLAD
jgi:phage shock protein A